MGNDGTHAATQALAEVEVAMAAEAIRGFAGVSGNEPLAAWGMVLGSGLGHVGDQLLEQGGRAIPFDRIPGFPCSSVTGHAGRLVLGEHRGVSVVVLQGRVHFYEGHSIEVLTRPVRTLIELGVPNLLLTNASGGVNRTFRVGDLMLIEDHISMLPAALIGDQNRNVWDRELRGRAEATAKSLGITLQRGIYAAMPGPTYETSAEVRMMRALGADTVGMSTVPEAVAVAGKARVVGLSCITNAAAGMSDQPITHDHVSEVGQLVSGDFGRLVLGLVAGDAMLIA